MAIFLPAAIKAGFNFATYPMRKTCPTGLIGSECRRVTPTVRAVGCQPAHPAGLEPATNGFGDHRSCQIELRVSITTGTSPGDE